MSPADPYGRRRNVPFDRADIPWEEVTTWAGRVMLVLIVLLVLLAVLSMFYRIDASDEGVHVRSVAQCNRIWR